MVARVRGLHRSTKRLAFCEIGSFKAAPPFASRRRGSLPFRWFVRELPRRQSTSLVCDAQRSRGTGFAAVRRQLQSDGISARLIVIAEAKRK
jgi:hypothetical protein